jgi:hypothetical protein
MIELSRLYEMTDLSLGNPNPLGELFWRFQSLIRFKSLSHLLLQPAPSHRTLASGNAELPALAQSQRSSADPALQVVDSTSSF